MNKTAPLVTLMQTAIARIPLSQQTEGIGRLMVAALKEIKKLKKINQELEKALEKMHGTYHALLDDQHIDRTHLQNLCRTAGLRDWLVYGTNPSIIDLANLLFSEGEPERIKRRLECLRGELESGSISYGDLAELQDLACHIDPSDVQLLEAVGVPEQTTQAS